MHRYFAYGSNLNAAQMAQRCPDALDPLPATLADHDWLINERGVATVEPADGAEVHGVLWQVSDSDLDVLDSAEGVPVRYRRDELVVHTEHGPQRAWVYIDHRVEPGDRWDPLHWPRTLAPTEAPGPQSLSELLADPGVEETSTLRSDFGFLAIHGGGLEQMTDVIAERAAERCPDIR
jgi:gamma-glutamylcyclotransferase (GGCT)/AIG2-like uncharacterized protein YtfP